MTTRDMNADVQTTDEPSQADKEYLSPKEFVCMTGLSLATVHRYLAAGVIPKIQPNGSHHRIMIPRDALKLIYSAPADLQRQGVDLSPIETIESNQHSSKPSKTHSGPNPRWKKRQHTQDN